jgi:hypothetical protein
MSALPASSITASPSSSVAATPRKPALPKTPKTPKTPTSGDKRKRGDVGEGEMSDDDESEPELSKASLAAVGCRTSTPRSTKNANKSYDEDTSDEEDDEGETRVEDGAEVKDSEANGAASGNHGLDDFFNFDGAVEKEANHLTGATPSKKRRMMQDDSDAQSDISSFSAGFD